MQEYTFHISDILDHVISSVPYFKPELALVIAFLGSIISTLTFDKKWKYSSLLITILGILFALITSTYQLNSESSSFFGMLIVDNFSVYARWIILLGVLISTLLIQQHFQEKSHKKNLGDVYSILLAGTLGLHLLTLTTNWLLAFIAIETISIASYILVGFFAENKKQSEAAMKYVLFGSASAAIMLYGLSLIYGFTGNLDFANSNHIQGLITAPSALLSIAIVFVFVGIGFKLSFVPMHLWSPDVYEGAPTPVTAFLSTVPKIGALVLLSRLFQAWSNTSFYFSELIFLIVSIAAIATMLIGNLVALRQDNIKRMMAYSSIGHTGFLLMAIVPLSSNEPQVVLFYLSVYTLMNLAVFAFIDVLEKKTGRILVSEYKGLGKHFPLIFSCFTILGISLVGLPPTAGFIGKLLVFTAVFEKYQIYQDYIFLMLLITGALTSVISLFFYFKIPLYAFLKKDNAELNFDKKFNFTLIISIAISFLIIIIGLFPSLILSLFN